MLRRRGPYHPLSRGLKSSASLRSMEEPARAPGGARCIVCGDPVLGPARPCERCEAPHHPECWEYSEGCAVYGCRGALVLAQAAVQARLAAENLPAVPPPAPSPGFAQGVLRARGLGPGQWRSLGFATMFLGISLMTLVSRLTGAKSAVLLLGLIPVAGLYMMLFSELLPEHVRFLTEGLLPPGQVEETPLKQLEARLGDDPRNAHLLDMVGHGCFAEGRFEDALERYDLLLGLRPGDRQARYRRARCLQKLGREAEAQEAFQGLLELPEDDAFRRRSEWWLGVLGRAP